MNDGRACFEIWAGEHEWSDWTKPTLFAGAFPVSGPEGGQGAQDLLEAARALLLLHADDSLTARGRDGARNCVVVDRPGSDPVAIGALLAERGFAPVVLCNGVTPAAKALIDNTPILRALAALAPRLDTAPEPSPAFLLDSRRLDGKAGPGWYDNRWLTFPQDFPSAGRLQAARIKRCLVLAEPNRIADDLAHVLRRWQDAGIEILDATPPEPTRIDVRTPPWFRQVFYRSLALAGLKPNSFGGFGAMIPMVHSGGGFG